MGEENYKKIIKKDYQNEGKNIYQFFNSAAGNMDAVKASMFMNAVNNDDRRVILAVLKENRDAVNWTDNEGKTPLMYAASKGNLELMKIFIQLQAHIEAENDNGSTALMFAAYSGYTGAVELLLSSGANANHQNKNGSTALMAAGWNGSLSTIKALLEAGAKTDLRDADNLSAADHAKNNGQADAATAIASFSSISTTMKEIAENKAEVTAPEPPATPEPPKRNFDGDMMSLVDRLKKGGLVDAPSKKPPAS